VLSGGEEALLVESVGEVKRLWATSIADELEMLLLTRAGFEQIGALAAEEDT